MTRPRPAEPLRWQDQTTSEKEIWKYFDEVAATRLVKAALSRHDLTLFDLAYALLKLRAKCEWVKHNFVKGDQPIEWFAVQEAYEPAGLTKDKEFSKLITYGISFEPSVINPHIWEQDVIDLVRERIVTQSGILHTCFKIGLSLITLADVMHQPKMAYKEMEPYFQRLISTDNIFEFLFYSSRIVYELSNHVATSRGTASVNSWIFGKIFQERLGQYFSHPAEVRPYLQDWIAFFEAPGEYTNYFVISAVADLLKSFPSLTQSQRNFLDSIPATMKLTPYRAGNNLKREASWKIILSIVQMLLKTNTLSAYDRQQLNNIAEGKLTFRKPFIFLQQLSVLISPKGKYDVSSMSKMLATMTDTDKAYLVKILNFEDQVDEVHYQSLGRDMDDEMHQLWFDLEILRSIEIKNINGKKFISELIGALGLKLIRNPKLDYNYYKYPKAYSQFPEWLRTSFVTPEEDALVPPQLCSMLNKAYQSYDVTDEFSHQIRAAIFSGGLKVQDMHHLSESQLQLLISPCALILYNSQHFIRARDLIDEDVAIMEIKILKLMNLHFPDNPLPNKVKAQRDRLLLSKMFDQSVPLPVNTTEVSPRQPRWYMMFDVFRRDAQQSPVESASALRKT